MQPRCAVRLLVVLAALLTGCATVGRARPTCGPAWEPLTITRAPHVHLAIAKPGAAIRIARVEVAGVDARLAAYLRRELRTAPGVTIADAPLRDDLRRLWRLGVIADARVEVDDDTVRFVVTPRPMIRSVVRTGGDALAQARFRRLESTTFEPARVRRMAEALRESYVQDGRLDARVEARQRTHAGGVDVCVALDPGPRVTIRKLEFPGRRALARRELLAALPKSKVNRPGGIYDEAAFEYARWYLLAEYWDRGFVEVKIDEPVVTRRGKRIDVAVAIHEGPVYRLGAVHVTVPLPFALAVKPGERFGRAKMLAAREAIEKALASYQVTVVPKTSVDAAARIVDVTFEVEWKWPWDALGYWLSRSR